MDFSETNCLSKAGLYPDEPRIYSYFTGAEFLEFIMDVFPDKKQEAKKRVRVMRKPLESII